MNGLDLFSGIGGITIALEDWVRPIAYCEQDRYCQAVLMSRMRDGSLPVAGVWDDVRTLNSKELPSRIDIIYGGFPCQDISVAGNGIGLGGERSGLYFEIERLIRETNPTFIFLENVPAIRTRGLGRVVWGLSELGYDCRWTTVSAAEVGAPHLRKRWFILAHSNGFKRRNEWKEKKSENRKMDRQPKAVVEYDGESKSLANTYSLRQQPKQKSRKHPSHWVGDGCENVANYDGVRSIPRGQPIIKSSEIAEFDMHSESECKHNQWSTEPNVGRVVNGLPLRVDRLRGLGNSVVPQQAREAFMRLSGLTPNSEKAATK